VNRAVMLRFAACGIIGLGSALLIAALLLSTYTSSKITKIPLDIDATLLSEGVASKALDSASLSGDHFVIDQNVQVMSQQQITVEAPANADVITLQAGTSVRRTAMQKDTGMLLAIVDTVTLNRKTAMAVSDDTHPNGFVQKPRAYNDENPPAQAPLPHNGLSYRFPYNTQKKTYPYFDPIAQKAYDANYEGEDDVNGLTTYKFTQNVGYNPDGTLANPVKYQSLYAGNEDGKVRASAATWGLQGVDPEEQITMFRYYAAQRTFWVDPVSGTIVRETEHANHYFTRENPLKPDVTLIDYQIKSTEDTVAAQVNSARDERDRLALWSRVLPITFTAVGLIALIGGGVLASFSLRTESALTDPGLDRGDEFFDHTGLEAPVPGAEAETEQLPTQHADLQEGPDPPESDPPESGPTESAPTEPGPPGPSERP
jgi:hypothetical protein